MFELAAARLETQLSRWRACSVCADNKICEGVDIGVAASTCPRKRWRAERTKKQRKLILRTGLPAGDIVALLFAVESLCAAYPGEFLVDVRTYHPAIFEGCPHIVPIADGAADFDVEMHYRTIDQSNQRPYRYLLGYLNWLEGVLGMYIPPAPWYGFLRIRDEEKGWLSAPREILGEDVPYWIIDAGYKTDYTCKQWELFRFQAIVDAFPETTFVQIGQKSAGHVHPELRGKNLIDMVNKTDLRQLIRLVYNSFGVITPVSMPMMLACAVPPHPRFKRLARACIVIAGGREPNHWQAMAGHQYLHTCGMLSCCDLGGCWASRIEPIGDEHDKTCVFCRSPVVTRSGQKIAKCMDMITAGQVILLVRNYVENLSAQ